MEHTPEPWQQDSEYVIAVVIGGRPGGEVIICAHPTVPRLLTTAQRNANARRIAACVNACTGVRTAELEEFGLGTVRTQARTAGRLEGFAKAKGGPESPNGYQVEAEK